MYKLLSILTLYITLSLASPLPLYEGRWVGTATSDTDDTWSVEFYFFYDTIGNLHYAAHSLYTTNPALNVGIDYENPGKTILALTNSTAKIAVAIGEYQFETGMIQDVVESYVDWTTYLSFTFLATFRSTVNPLTGQIYTPSVQYSLVYDYNTEWVNMCADYCDNLGFCNVTSNQCIYTTYYFEGTYSGTSGESTGEGTGEGTGDNTGDYTGETGSEGSSASTTDMPSPSVISASTETGINVTGVFFLILIAGIFACLCAGFVHCCCNRRRRAAALQQKKPVVAMPLVPQQPTPQPMVQMPMMMPQAPGQPYPYMQFVPQYYAYPNGYPQYIQPYAPVPQQEQ